MGGQIVDATVVAAPKQRNTEADKGDLKADRVPVAWRAQPTRPSLEDRDACWMLKWSKAKPTKDGAKWVDIAVPAFGHKNHVGIDRRHGLIRPCMDTDATCHCGAQLIDLLSKANIASTVWVDTAYRSEANEAHHRSRWLPLPRLSQEPVEQADGEERRSRQRRKVECPRCRRARLRPAEGADGARGAHDRLGASSDEDRASKPRVQHELGSLAHQLTDEGSLRIGAEDLNAARAGDKERPRSAK